MEEEKKRCQKKVMVAIDERGCSYHALMWVLKNLKESITKSPLVIFAAQPLPEYRYFTFAAELGFAHMYCPLLATSDLVDSVKKKNKKVARGLLEKAKGICARQGVKVETVTEVGDPKETICNAVEKYEISLLVVGDQANGILQRAFQESLSSYCLKNAKCPVLVVNESVIPK
ncbi:universal stress protein A-like protein isoform X1 [Herrania umbratica]|uniref:Universal stress protein A-like protein isoform X1 n=2 Tax=Herrania umbratica TaxID=108875 RepID=A0A6J1BIE4_9ROSI|nr:universal stress protein A-like protein isoform X1 [Herrania umbratica]